MKNLLKRIPFIILLSAWLSLAAEPLTLFFTNDTHGAYLPNTYKTSERNIELGGYVNLDNLLKMQRDFLPNTLWLDAGDQQTGSAFASLNYKKALGGAVIEAFNLMDLDAATLGNHEFDQSFANTKQLIKIADYPFVNANLIDKKTGKPFTGKPYKIFSKGNLKIGVLGLTLTDLPEKVKTDNVSPLQVLPYKQAIDKYIDKLDAKTDLIILLTHNGFEADSLLATQLDRRIDLIVGGHSHTILEKPVRVNGIYIVQTGAFLAYYGRLDLEVIADSIANDLTSQNCLFPVLQTKTEKPTKLMQFIAEMEKRIDQDLNRVIGYTAEDWIPDKYNETTVSEWQAKALYTEYYDKFKPDLAMINCGGIRKAVPAGPITYKDLTEMLPFTNYIAVFSCYGKDLPAFIKHNLKMKQTKEHDIVQTYNLSWESHLEDDSLMIDQIKIGGVDVIPDKIYKIVSHDFLAGQADKYLMFEPINPQITDDLILDVIVRQVEKQYGKKNVLTK